MFVDIDKFGVSRRTEIHVYPMDTLDTVTARIAHAAAVLPAYIYIHDLDSIDTERVHATVIFDEQDLAAVDPVRFVLQHREHFGVNQLLTLWAHYTDAAQRAAMSLVLPLAIPDLASHFGDGDTSFDNMIAIADMAPARQRYQETIRKEWVAFHAAQVEMETTFRRVDALPEAEFTVARPRRYDMRGIVRSSAPIAYIFDVLETSVNVPIMAYGAFIKVHRFSGMTASDMKTPAPGTLRARILSFPMTVTTEDDHVVFSVAASDPDEEIQLREAITQLFQKFVVEFLPVQFLMCYQSSVDFNAHILADLVMSQRLLEPFFALNDKRQYTETGEISMYYRNPYTTAADERIFISMRKGTRLSTTTTDEQVLAMLRKLAGVYAQESTRIKTFYRGFGIVFKDTTVSAAEIQKEVFGFDFTKKCQPMIRPPIAVADEEYAVMERIQTNDAYLPTAAEVDVLRQLEARMPQYRDLSKHTRLLDDEKELVGKYAGLETVMFPKAGDEHVAPSTRYICIHPEYPFPGLIKNTKTQLQYQPCCFASAQTDRPNMQTYYGEGDVVESRGNTGTAYMVRTDKIIMPGKLGMFSEKTKNQQHLITTLLQHASDSEVYRVGIPHTPHSFLECIMVAMNTTGDVRAQRRRLFQSIEPSLLAQQMYDSTLEEIREYVTQSDAFLDPLLTVRLLEVYFDCSILIFQRDKQYKQGRLALPRHTAGYCEWKRDATKPSVFVYFHMGSDSDRLTMPHCELIGYKNAEGTVKTVFNSAQRMTRFCWATYDDLVMSYTQNGKAMGGILPLVNVRVVAQWIDVFGKTRCVLVRWNDTDLLPMYTPPFAPLNVPVFDVESVALPSKEIVSALFPDGVWDMDTCAVRVQGYIFHVRVASSTSPMFPEYVRLERLSRFLSNWFVFQYSRFLAATGANAPSLESLQAFVRRSTRVDASHVYGKPTPEFTRVANTAVVNGIFVCTSDELRERLQSQTYLLLMRDPDAVMAFGGKRYLDNFYKHVYDFMEQPQSVLVTSMVGAEAPTVHVLRHVPTVEKQYFLQHPSIENGAVVSVTATTAAAVPGESTLLYMYEGSDVRVVTTTEDVPRHRFVVCKFEGVVHWGRIERVQQ